MSEAHERKVKRIMGRNWDDLCMRWIQYVPNIVTPGTPPTIRLHELPELAAALGRIDKQQVNELDDIPGLRAGVLHEGIFWAHKAVHVLGSALVHVSNGMCTWSLSSAYHSAFFSLKAALNLLGVATIESPTSGNFLIDIWGVPHERKKRKLYPVFVLASTGRNEPRHLWAYLQRTLSQTTAHSSICNSELYATLVQSDFTDFARQRNDIHYRTHVWGGNDLHACLQVPGFGLKRVDCFDTANQDFSLLLAFGMARMVREMLHQIAVHSMVVEHEIGLIDHWLAEPFNDLYQRYAI